MGADRRMVDRHPSGAQALPFCLWSLHHRESVGCNQSGRGLGGKKQLRNTDNEIGAVGVTSAVQRGGCGPGVLGNRKFLIGCVQPNVRTTARTGVVRPCTVRVLAPSPATTTRWCRCVAERRGVFDRAIKLLLLLFRDIHHSGFSEEITPSFNKVRREDRVFAGIRACQDWMRFQKRAHFQKE